MESVSRQKLPILKRILGPKLRLVLVCLLLILGNAFIFVSPVHALPPNISSFPAPLPPGTVGVPYNAILTASGGTGSFAWSSPPVIPGLNYATGGTGNNTFTISGTPSTGGTFYFSVTVTSGVETATFSQPINIVAPALIFDGENLPQATEAVSYSASFSVSGGTRPYSFAIISGTLPSGLRLGATSGTITGTPGKGTAGTHTFTVKVTDSSSPTRSGEASFELFIDKGSFQPTVTIGTGLKAGETRVFSGATQLAVLKGGESLTLDLDLGATRSIGVDATVEHPTETGVRFKAEQDRISVSEASPTATFTYYTEYQIEIKTNPSGIAQFTGSNWYKEGYVLRANAPSEIDATNTPGTKYRFANWVLPTGETVSGQDLNLTVNAPGSVTANYDTYYKLTLTSAFGDPEGVSWHKAGSEAKWTIATPEVSMSGLAGVFGGKHKAVNTTGTVLMDGPKTVAVNWRADYTLPVILIPLTLLLILVGVYGLYRLWQSGKPKPFPYYPPPPPYMPPPPPQPLPPPQTTVVLMGDKLRQLPQSTREQLMESFGDLLAKYEQEIKGPTGAPPARRLAEPAPIREDRRLAAPDIVPPVAEEAEWTTAEESTHCSFSAKRLLRTVVGGWKQVDTRTTVLSRAEEVAETTEEAEAAEEHITGLAVTWSRDIYQEWEVFSCSLPRGHRERHEGNVKTVYTLLNTVTGETTHGPGEKLTPPSPHYTDGMPQAELPADKILSLDQLPPETVS